MKKSVKNCIGYIGQISKNHDVRKFEKSAPSKIENLVDISMFFYDRANRPASGDLNPIFDTDFSRRIGCYWSPIFYMVPEWFLQIFAKSRVFFSEFWFLFKKSSCRPPGPTSSRGRKIKIHNSIIWIWGRNHRILREKLHSFGLIFSFR